MKIKVHNAENIAFLDDLRDAIGDSVIDNSKVVFLDMSEILSYLKRITSDDWLKKSLIEYIILEFNCFYMTPIETLYTNIDNHMLVTLYEPIGEYVEKDTRVIRVTDYIFSTLSKITDDSNAVSVIAWKKNGCFITITPIGG